MPPIKLWKELNKPLHNSILDVINKLKFDKMTPVQVGNK